MAINTLLADNAVLGAFHFSNNVFWSGDGGSSSSAAKLYMNSSTGEFRAESATIKGNITATSGTFTGTITATSGTFTNGTFTNCTTSSLTITGGNITMTGQFVDKAIGNDTTTRTFDTKSTLNKEGLRVVIQRPTNDGSGIISIFGGYVKSLPVTDYLYKNHMCGV
jgi:hypothetical protein